MIKPQPLDISSIPLQGTLNGIPLIQNIVTTSGTWHSVTMEFEESKQMILQPRQAVDWYFSSTQGGDYFTLRQGAALQAPIVTTSGSIVGWVSCDQDMVFELMVGR
jgi:hypothetical protein